MSYDFGLEENPERSDYQYLFCSCVVFFFCRGCDITGTSHNRKQTKSENVGRLSSVSSVSFQSEYSVVANNVR